MSGDETVRKNSTHNPSIVRALSAAFRTDVCSVSNIGRVKQCNFCTVAR